MSYTGLKPSFTSATTSAAMIAGTGITIPVGNVTVSSGNVTVSDSSLNGIIAGTFGNFLIDKFYGGGMINGIFVGVGAGNTTNTGNGNIAVGASALTGLTDSPNNCVVGYFSLGSLTTGNGLNSGLGYQALSQLVSGTRNVGIGVSSGVQYTGAESSNIVIGAAGTTGESNKIRIGTDGSGDGQQNACFIAGISGVTVATSVPVVIGATGQMGTIVSSARFKENIEDMPETNVLSLRPVTFNYKADESNATEYGLIAEEVEKVMPDLVVYDDNRNPHSVRYHLLPAILLAEIQKLQKRIEILEKNLKNKK